MYIYFEYSVKPNIFYLHHIRYNLAILEPASVVQWLSHSSVVPQVTGLNPTPESRILSGDENA